jgi:hypothetical protein
MMMSRGPHYLGILEATAIMQDNIALMLEAKAVEADKSKSWICYHLHQSSFGDQHTQLKTALDIHEKVVEVIGGLVRMEQSLAANLKVMIGDNEDETESGDFDFGSMFGQNEEK